MDYLIRIQGARSNALVIIGVLSIPLPQRLSYEIGTDGLPVRSRFLWIYRFRRSTRTRESEYPRYEHANMAAGVLGGRPERASSGIRNGQYERGAWPWYPGKGWP